MTQKTSGAKKVAVGLGIAGIAAAGLAGAYFLYGSKDAKKNRNKVKSWMLKTKAEIMDKVEKAKELTEENFSTIVDTAAAKYGKNISADELTAYTKSLKKYWKDIKREVSGGVKKVAKKK